MDKREKTRILVVEDEASLARYLQLELQHVGYHVETVQNGYEAVGILSDGNWDLVILDLMLPGLDGLEVCRRVRKQSNLPIIMLTAKETTLDKVKGLDAGADDYITKPFVIDELLARVRARLRSKERTQRNGNTIIIRDLEISLDTRQVMRNGKLISLTKREFDLLAYLAENAGLVLSRETLLTHVWGYNYYENENVVDVYIRYLRAKVDEPFSDHLIQTVRGVGFTLRGGN